MTIKQTFIQIDLERARKIEKEREDRKERERMIWKSENHRNDSTKYDEDALKNTSF